MNSLPIAVSMSSLMSVLLNSANPHRERVRQGPASADEGGIRAEGVGATTAQEERADRGDTLCEQWFACLILRFVKCPIVWFICENRLVYILGLYCSVLDGGVLFLRHRSSMLDHPARPVL